MIKNYIRNIRGFKPVELVVLVSVSLLIAGGFFFGLSNNQPAPINVNVQPPEVTVYVDGQQMASKLSRTPTASAGHLISTCGNSILELRYNGYGSSNEQCDDGDTDSGDGCSATCQVEAVPANFITEPGEQCDDGNTDNSDGCSNSGVVKVECPGGNIVGTVCTLSPDTGIDHENGVQDVSNLQSAMYWAKAVPGRTVHLTSGNFYVSRSIVVNGFTGTLKGSGMNSTTINVGRRHAAAGGGFSPAYHPFWAWAGYNPILPTVLQLDNSTGLVTIADLTIEVVGDQPTDLMPDYYGDLRTAIATIIEIQAGDNSTDFYNVRMKGKVTNAEGNNNKMNVAYGFHDMYPPGAGATSRKPFLNVRNVEVENLGRDAILGMNFEKITIENVIAKNVFVGTFLARVSRGSISNTETSLHSLGSRGIDVSDSSNFTISGNTVSGRSNIGGLYFNGLSNSIISNNTIKDVTVAQGHRSAIYVWNSHNNTISKNKFENVLSNGVGYGAIRVRGGSSGNNILNNDYSESGLMGYVNDGLGNVFMDGSTSGNDVMESVGPTGTKFPLGTSLCTPQVLNYGNNSVKGYEACENNPNWDSILQQLESTLDIDTGPESVPQDNRHDF